MGMLGRYYRLMHGKWSCFRELVADPARFQVLFLLVTGSRLLNQPNSTVPAVAQDGPSSERGRDKHPDELLQSSGAALRSSVPVRSKSENREGGSAFDFMTWVVEAVKTDTDTHDDRCHFLLICLYITF